MTHSFAQATPEIGGPGNKNKHSASSGRTFKRSESTSGESQSDATPVGYDLGGSSDSLLVGRCQPKSKIRKSHGSCGPATRGSPAAPGSLPVSRGRAYGGRTGSLRLWPSRQPGSADVARHQTIAHLADARLGIPEFGLGLGTFLPGWRRWSLRRCTPSTRPRRRADLTSGHHSGGGSDRNGQALRQTRTPVASGAAATTPTTPVSPLPRRIPDRKGDPFGAKKSWSSLQLSGQSHSPKWW